MISKNKLKYIKSLQIKKFRKEEQSFIVEGAKSILELLDSDFVILSLFLTEEFFNCYRAKIDKKQYTVIFCTSSELEAAGSFLTNNAGIAIVSIKPNLPLITLPTEYSLVLDNINDPGNLGTIIRIADWFGINKIICSTHTADVYNPKVISATMGSFTRVSLYYCNLIDYLNQHKTFLYGAKLEGKNLHNVLFNPGGMILIGNESFGISQELEPFIDENIVIPQHGHAESLNAGIATAIICDNLRRIVPVFS